MDIQILRDGKQTGPYTEEAVHALLKEGSVHVNDLAWRPGLAEWVPLVNVLYPAATGTTAPSAPETPEPDSAAAPREPATARQKAFLDYVGIAFAPDASKDDAAQLVNEAMENPRDPARLARWNEERLHLHPALFAAEIQARKENRSQHFLEIVHEEGAPFFEKVTKAHCQVLVAHLDVHCPNWDTKEREAAVKYFFPALAEKFPQLVTDAGRAKFKTPDKAAATARHPSSSPASVKVRPSSGSRVGKVLYAMARGVFVGLLILGLLWIGRGAFASKTPPAKKTAPAPVPLAVEETTPPPAKAAPEAAPPASHPADKPAEMATAPAASPSPTTPEPAPSEMKTPAAGTDLPRMNDTPAAAPAPSLIPASPTRTSVILTKAVQITLPFGKISVPPGTTVKILSQSGSSLTVRYLDHVVTIPASSTDLGTDPAAIPQ